MSIVCIMGLPGAGKTTLLESLARVYPTCSRYSYDSYQLPDDRGLESVHVFRKSCEDKIRQEISADIDDIRRNRRVLIIDDILYLQSMRRPYVRLARRLGLAFVTVFVNTPPDICCARNEARPIISRISSTVILNMYEKLEIPDNAIHYDGGDVRRIVEFIDRSEIPEPCEGQIDEDTTVGPCTSFSSDNRLDTLTREAVKRIRAEKMLSSMDGGRMSTVRKGALLHFKSQIDVSLDVLVEYLLKMYNLDRNFHS